MTDQERDPEAAAGAAGPTDEGDTAPGTEPDETAEDELEEAPEDEAYEAEAEEEGEEAGYEGGGFAEPEPETAVPAGAERARGPERGRGRQPALRAAPMAPSVSEQAVRVDDRASAVFVLGVVAVFVGILLYGMLFGHAGFLTGLLATPTPTEVATPVVSVSPGASESPAGSAASPGASGSPAGSASPAGSPAASAPASAAPSPAAS
jgi:hypothetical protein